MATSVSIQPRSTPLTPRGKLPSLTLHVRMQAVRAHGVWDGCSGETKVRRSLDNKPHDPVPWTDRVSAIQLEFGIREHVKWSHIYFCRSWSRRMGLNVSLKNRIQH